MSRQNSRLSFGERHRDYYYSYFSSASWAFHLNWLTTLGIASSLFRHNDPLAFGKPCRILAAASTGNSFPSTIFALPFLSPASTSHQFRRVFLPCRSHFAVTSSIN